MAVTDSFSGTLGNWTDQNWVPGSPPGLLGGAAFSSALSQFSAMYWSAHTWNANQRSKVTIKSATTYGGPAVRSSGTSASTINLYTYQAHGSLQKFTNGAQSILGVTPVAAAVNDSIELDITGTTLTCFKNGASGVSTTDASFATGNVGVQWFSNTLGVDDFVGTGENPYSYAKTITIDHTQAGGANSTNFPFTLVVTDPDLRTIANGGKVASASGFDLRPFDSARTNQLPFELVSYAPTTGAIELHILLPALSSTVDTVISLCFGDTNRSLADVPLPLVWDSNFVVVYHTSQGAAISGKDSAGGLNPVVANTAVVTATGQVGRAWSFDGSTSYLRTADSASLQLTTAFTIELWFKPANLTSGPSRILSKLSGDNTNNDYAVFWETTDNTAEFYTSANTAGAFAWSGTGSRAAIGDTNWHHLAWTYNGSSYARYLDGVQGGVTAESVTLPATGSSLYLGTFSTTSHFLNGLLDEIRLSKVARSQAWMIATYNSQRTQTGGGIPSGDFYTLGTLTALATGITGTLTSTLATSTLTAAATVAVTGLLSRTLATSTLSAQGTVAITAVLAATPLAPVTVSGTGVVGSVPIMGTLSAALAPATLTATAAVLVTGTLSAAPLAPATLTGQATVALTATLTATLAPATLSATGVVAALAPVVGTLSRPLATSTLSATGTVAALSAILGTLSRTLGPAVLAGAGHVAPLPAVCPTTTLADLQTLMIQRWDGVVFWTAEEARLALNEALREWNLLTGRWRTRATVANVTGPEVALPGVMTYGMRVSVAAVLDTFAFVAAAPLTPASLAELELGRPTWRLDTTADGGDVPPLPTIWAPLSLTRIAIWPSLPVGLPIPLLVDGVLRTPVLVTPTDLVDLGEEIIDYIVDMALHVAAFKEAGARWRATRPYFEAFLQAAAEENALLKTNQRYRRWAGLDRRRDLQPSTGAANQISGLATQFSRHDQPTAQGGG